MSFHKWLQRREYGVSHRKGDSDFIMKRVFKSMDAFQHWNDLSDKPNHTSDFGAVFNLEFSPEGNVVVAACEKKSILLFDAITTKQTNQITDAHRDNVNCIKFLDDRMFASCSDDTTVALWDLRYLKMKVRSLHGHSNWVKNIEYSHKDNLLVTSGFDGSIFTWDIKSHTEQGLIYQKVFHTSGLMRCRISPDGTKLVICTTGGYLMIIHNLDLTTLHKDLCGFRPTIYRLMQMGQQYIPQAAKFDHVFSKKQKKNRVELVTDFPEENDAEVILALQIHPKGHSFLSRNITYDEVTEWSCIHDINEEPDDITERSVNPNRAERKRKFMFKADEDVLEPDSNDEGSGDSADEVFFGINQRRRMQRGRASGRSTPPPQPALRSYIVAAPANRQETFVPDIWAAEVTVQERAIRQNRARSSSNSVTGYNFVYAISSGVLPAAAAAAQSHLTSTAITTNASASSNTDGGGGGGRNNVGRRRLLRSNTPNNVAGPSSTDGSSTSSSGDSPPHRDFDRIRMRSLLSSLSSNNHGHHIFQNPPKLVYYIQESNNGKGFIKEPCFSADGRIICSPYDTGVRFLAFTEDCSEYPRHNTNISSQRQPRPLAEVKTISSHSDIVLCTKFSPREPLLATGCRSGKVVWYHPNF